MLRRICGLVARCVPLALTGALVIGCGEQQASEPTSRAEDRTAQLDQQQMISEDDASLRAKSAQVADVDLPSCHELGAALGERVASWRLLEQQSDGVAAASADEAAGSDPDAADSLAGLSAESRADSISTGRRCEWHSRPAAEGDHGLVVAVELASGQMRRTEVAGHVLDLPTVERAGGFVVTPTGSPDLRAPLDAEGASVVIGRTSVHIAAPRIDGVAADANLDLESAIAAALEIQHSLAR